MTLGELTHTVSHNEWVSWKPIKIELTEHHSGDVLESQNVHAFEFNDYEEMLLNGDLKHFYHYNVVKWVEDVNCYYIYGYECKTVEQHDKHILFEDTALEEELNNSCLYFG